MNEILLGVLIIDLPQFAKNAKVSFRRDLELFGYPRGFIDSKGSIAQADKKTSDSVYLLCEGSHRSSNA
jgi:hypothetical protein